ncbi:MAG: division/cell wall cluster transcriptional repressor MraZ [Clostridia bacterium]
MLISSFEHSVDAKGRVFIPAKWREDLGNTVIITRGMLGKGDSRCLFGMSVPVWSELLEKFKKLALSDVTAQNAMRLLFANAAECDLDKQGRVLITASLREQAGIDENAMLIGMGNRIEIWSAAGWSKHVEETDDISDEVLRYLSELGI